MSGIESTKFSIEHIGNSIEYFLKKIEKLESEDYPEEVDFKERKGIFRLFSRKNDPIAKTLNALKNLKPLFYENDLAIEIEGIDACFKQTECVIKTQKNNVIKAINVDKWSSRDLALLLLSKQADYQLCSGWNHIHRGLLSPAGHGYMYVWKMAAALLLQSGFFNRKQVDEDLKNLTKEITEAG
jgi:hypothetical protein